MHLEYEISEEDYIAATRLAQRGATWLSYIRYLRFAIVIIVLLVSLVAHGGEGSNDKYVSLGVVLVALVVYFLLRGYQAKKQFKKATNLHGRQYVDIDDTSLRFVTPSSDARVTWANYSKYRENDKAFVLYTPSSQIFVPIPKRELNSLQIQELHILMESHLGKKK